MSTRTRKYLSRAEVSDIYGISEKTLERLQADGLPYYRIRRRVMYKDEEVEQFFQKQRVNIKALERRAYGIQRRSTQHSGLGN